MLQRGSSGEEVEALQKKLAAMGINPGPVDGVFGPKSDHAVRRYQEQHGLEIDGIAGPMTLGALGLADESAAGGGTEDEQEGGGASGGGGSETAI